MRRLMQTNAAQASDDAGLELSVVCPFYNEEVILTEALAAMLASLRRLDKEWELIVVDDGSTDGSRGIAKAAAADEPRLRVIHYDRNRGRGHALRSGIANAQGDVIVTTEMDLSWGEDIVERLDSAMAADPYVDIIVASPNLPGGGYRNVPWNRVWVSRLGNLVVRALVTNVVTMNTGMTRAYRRDVIQSIPLDEDRKEFHLEVISKAYALGYRIAEIPAVLEWKTFKGEAKKGKRKSSSKTKRLMLTHSLFSLFANPIRYVWGLSGIVAAASTIFFLLAVGSYLTGEVAAYAAIVSLSLALMAVVLFSFGIVVQQGNAIQLELWRLKRDLLREINRPQRFLEQPPKKAPAAAGEAGEST